MKRLLILFSIFLFSGCATTGETTADEAIYDPWEKFNRNVFNFNQDLDKSVIRPIAVKYKTFAPVPLRNGIRNFFSNLSEPTTIINQLLQGKFEPALLESWRFLFNSTIGVLGFMDVATRMGLHDHDEDFGQTLAKWGLGPGPYLMLPVLGPSDLRDTAGLIPQYLYTDPVYYLNDIPVELGLISVNFTSKRADLLGTDALLQQSGDPYLFLRSAYFQTRESLIYDGNPPLKDLYEEN